MSSQQTEGPGTTELTTRAVDADEHPSTAVVLAVAAVTGTDPVALSPPLHELVDPDALDAIVEGGDGRVAFDAYGYRIVVDGTAVEVRRPSVST